MKFLSLKEVSKLAKSDRDFYKQALANPEKRTDFFFVATELLEATGTNEECEAKKALIDKMVEILYSTKAVRTAILSKLEFIEKKYLNEEEVLEEPAPVEEPKKKSRKKAEK